MYIYRPNPIRTFFVHLRVNRESSIIRSHEYAKEAYTQNPNTFNFLHMCKCARKLEVAGLATVSLTVTPNASQYYYKSCSVPRVKYGSRNTSGEFRDFVRMFKISEDEI